jgi:signal transduction histidine kinase
MQQVMTNLVSNAVDAMAGECEGPKVLTIRSHEEAADAIRVEVIDRGQASPQLDSMFDASFTTKPNGMGMGLTICRAILNCHGGRLWATRNTHAGTTVSFTLPLYSEAGRDDD